MGEVLPRAICRSHEPVGQVSHSRNGDDCLTEPGETSYKEKSDDYGDRAYKCSDMSIGV